MAPLTRGAVGRGARGTFGFSPVVFSLFGQLAPDVSLKKIPRSSRGLKGLTPIYIYICVCVCVYIYIYIYG